MARTFGRLLAGASAAAVLVAAGCGEGGDAEVRAGRPADFAATSRYLTGVVDDASEQPYRFTLTTGIAIERDGGGDGEAHAQLATGAFDGERTQVRLDLAAVAAAEAEATGTRVADVLPRGLDRDDLVMEVVTAPGTAYMRTPYIQAMAATDPTVRAEAPASFFLLGDALAAGWVSLDMAALDDVDPGRAADAVAGNRNCDPAMYLDLVRGSGSVEEIGSDELAGVAVTGLAADVPLADLLRRQGARLSPALRDGAADVTVPVEVWVDGDGHIRRVHVALDMVELLTEVAGERPAHLDDLEELIVTETLDVSDYGDESIRVEIPAGAVDMTATFVDLLRAARQGPAGTGTPPGGIEEDLAVLEDLYADLGGPGGQLGSMEPPPFDPAMEAQLAELEEAYQDMESLPEIPEPPPLPPMPEVDIPPMPEIPEVEIPEIPDMPQTPMPTMPPPPPPPPPLPPPPPPPSYVPPPPGAGTAPFGG